MNPLENLLRKVPDIEQRLGYTFKNKNLLALAMIHRSFINENREIIDGHNERLEFLGDSVLGFLIAEYLYKELPTQPEGELSHLRSRLVEASSCVQYLQKLEIEPYILLSKGERMSEGRGRETILADLFEAVIGAIYLDGGYEASKQFLFANFLTDIQGLVEGPSHNWKAELQDYVQKRYQQAPIYRVMEETGPDHSKIFHISVFVREDPLGTGTGNSKKEAQQAAAFDALSKLQSQSQG